MRPIAALALLLAAATPAAESPARPQVTEAVLARFTPARLRELDESIAFFKGLKAEAAARERAGRQATLADATEAQRRAKAHEEAMAKLRRETGLSAAEWGEARRLTEEVGSERSAWRLAGGDEGIARTEASVGQQLASLPAAQRAAILDGLTGKLKQAKRAEKARKAWGDALVEATIPFADALEAKRVEALQAAR